MLPVPQCSVLSTCRLSGPQCSALSTSQLPGPQCSALSTSQLPGPSVLNSPNKSLTCCHWSNCCICNSYPNRSSILRNRDIFLYMHQGKTYVQRLSYSFMAFGAVSKYMNYIHECIATNTGDRTMPFLLNF